MPNEKFCYVFDRTYTLAPAYRTQGSYRKWYKTIWLPEDSRYKCALTLQQSCKNGIGIERTTAIPEGMTLSKAAIETRMKRVTTYSIEKRLVVDVMNEYFQYML